MNTKTTRKALFFKIDPRTKLLFILSVGGIVNGSAPEWWQFTLVLVAALLCTNERMYKIAIKFVVAYVTMWGGMELIKQSGIVYSVTTSVMLICVIIKWFIPGILCALALIKSTTVSQLMAVADRMKIPYNWAIPLAVVLRFFPTLREEWENIRRAMKMRRIGISLEHVMVPIISASVRIGEELSAAALSRGLGYAKKRTNMCQIRLQVTDYILMLLFIGNGVVTYGKIL